MGASGSIIASGTWGDFGALLGVAAVRNEVRVTGFETIGWTNANLSATQRTTGARNATGGGNWTIPGTVPANAGNGLTTGATIDEAFLLARNPGLTIDQIDNAIIPRLGRPADEFGYLALARVLFRDYPRRAVLGASLMISQSFLYNAIFFTYALVLGKFYGVSAEAVPLFLIVSDA